MSLRSPYSRIGSDWGKPPRGVGYGDVYSKKGRRKPGDISSEAIGSCIRVAKWDVEIVNV
jgi:hypothetical protein